MTAYEVPEPILNSPFDEPAWHWHIVEGETPERRAGRRSAIYFYRDPKVRAVQGGQGGTPVELVLVNLIRGRVGQWRNDGYPGVTRTTLELLQWWRREGREPLKRQFFAQIEAAETVIFLKEARADYRQGIDIPPDDPSDEQKEKGHAGFLRYACKMATGTRKTTVMGMLAAWSILNKVTNRGDGRFSDTVLVICPNVTIRGRLRELSPDEGEASIYRTRELVPGHLMPLMTQGKGIGSSP